eukprot:m.445516 g.445516  ORF g.445516 m.445516 type:complete len:82 (-) comp56853_c0_seq5:244-489(-)
MGGGSGHGSLKLCPPCILVALGLRLFIASDFRQLLLLSFNDQHSQLTRPRAPVGFSVGWVERQVLFVPAMAWKEDAVAVLR